MGTKYVATVPNPGDTRHLRWLKCLAALQAVTSSGTKNDPTITTTTRVALLDFARSLGLTPPRDGTQRRLLKLISDRILFTAFTISGSPPALPHFGTACTARRDDDEAILEDKFLAELLRFTSPMGLHPVTYIADRGNTRTVLVRKMLAYLNVVDPDGTGGGSVPAFTIYTTSLISADAGAVTFAHGLGQVPPIVMPVLVCTSDDAGSGMVAGNEVPVKFVSGSVLGSVPISFVTVDATTLYVSTGGFSVGQESQIGAGIIGDFNNFKLKVYVAVPASTTPTFTANPAVPYVGATSVLHGLGSTPTMVVPVIKCASNDANTGYVAGDEFPSYSFASPGNRPFVMTGMNSTSIFTALIGMASGQESTWTCPVKGNNSVAASPSSFSHFLVKVRAWSLTGGYQTPITPSGTGKVSFNHGLGKTPQIVIPVIVCRVDDASTGYVAGEQIMPEVWTNDGGGTDAGACQPAMVFYSNATQITIDKFHFSTGLDSFLDTINKDGARNGPVDPANFGLQLYAFAL